MQHLSRRPPVRPATRPNRKASAERLVEALEDRTLFSTFTVVNTLDNGSIGSLRWAINQANATSGADTVAFDASTFATPQTITLTTGQLTLSDTSGATTITGPAAGVTVSGNNASRVLTVNEGVTANLSRLTLTAGRDATGMGGGLLNSGNTTLTDSVVSGNTTSGGNSFGASGGGVYNRGVLTLVRGAVSGNSARYGGGVYSEGNLTASGTVFSGNTASLVGGALATGGTYMSDRVNAIALTGCEISGNTAYTGGGVANNVVLIGGAPFATLALTNCTVAHNHSSADVYVYPPPYFGTRYPVGGGVHNAEGLTTLLNCTVSNNTGGHNFIGAGVGAERGEIRIQNTLVTGNTESGGYVSDVGRQFTSLGNNLISSPQGTVASYDDSSGWVADDLLGAAAGVGPLGHHGGPTRTSLLLPGSAAIDAAASGAGVPATDQRGLNRLGAPDIGAVESQGYTFAAVSGAPQSAHVAFGFADPLRVKLTENVTNLPLPGAGVIFAGPASGAGIKDSQTAFTDATGVASTFVTSNLSAGSYAVNATSGGVHVASFDLQNIGVASLEVTPGEASIFDTFTQQYAATAVYADGGRRDVTHTGADVTHPSHVTWASSRPQVAEMDNSVGFSGFAYTPGSIGTWPRYEEIGMPISTVITATFAGVTSPGVTLTVLPAPNLTFVVTNTNDGGAGSLRDAIAQAANSYGRSTVTFDPAVFGTARRTITLTAGTIDLATDFSNGLNIRGPGADRLTIVGGSAAPTFSVRTSTSPSRLAPGSISLSGLTLSGGGVSNRGTLGMTDCAVTDVYSDLNGGAPVYGVYNAATLTMTGCTVSGNGSAVNEGGGVANDGTLAMANSTVSGNSGGASGGGVVNRGTLTMTGSTVSGNRNAGSHHGGGGIRNTGVPLLLYGCIVAGNAAPLAAAEPDIEGPVSGFSSNNLIGLGTAPAPGTTTPAVGLTGITHGVDGNQVGTSGAAVDPLLGPLADNGGPTKTMALQSGSPAIDAGSNDHFTPGSEVQTVMVGEDAWYSLSFNGGTTDDLFSGFDPYYVDYVLESVPTIGFGRVTVTPIDGGYTVTFDGDSATFDGNTDVPQMTSTVHFGSVSVTTTRNGNPVNLATDQRGAGFARISDGAADIGAFELSGAPTATAVTSSAASSTYGDSVTFTATVTAASTPAGGVNFVIDGGTPMAGFADTTTGTTATWSYTTSALGAGPHTVEAVFDGSGDFGDSTAALSGGQLVNKADATVVVTPYTVTYDGNAHIADVTSITGVNGETGAAVGTVTLSGPHTDAGTYKDTWNFVGGLNYNDIAATAITNVISKASSTTTVTVNGNSFTYTGLPQTPATVLVTGAGGLMLTPAASYADNVNAGTATAGYTFAGDANHTGNSDSERFTIGKADASVAVTPYTVTYDGSPHAAAYTVSGVNGEAGVTVGSVTLSPAHTDAGTYADAWSFTGGANYNDVAAMPMTNVIDKAASTVTVTINGDLFTYTGLAQTPATVLVTGAGGLSLTPAAAYANNVNAGTATASYDYPGDANHEAASGSDKFAIAKADATFTVTPYAVTYDRTPHTAAVSAVTGVNGESGAAVGTVLLDTTHTDAGTYADDSLSFTGGANYNDVAATPITNTIDKAALKITADDDTKVLGTLKTFAATAFSQTGLIAGDAITGVTAISAGAPVSAGVGTYAIELSGAAGTGLANYDIAYVNGTLTVLPPVSVPAGVQHAFEDVDKPIAGIRIAGGLTGSLTLKLVVGHGTLKLATTAGLTITGNNSGSVSLTGTTVNLNAALAGLVYRGRLNYAGGDTLSLTLGNGSFSWDAGVAISVASSAQQANTLSAQVNALKAAGVLSTKQADVLLANLSLQGNDGDVGKVGSFLNNVRGYLKSKVLTQAQAGPLLSAGNVLLLSVTRR